MSSIWDWSTIAANNSTADGSINWQEGQLPSTVNDSSRQQMGRVAELLDDLGGLGTVGGTANAITLTSVANFSALANGIIVGLKPTANNTSATVTLNVNSLGAKNIRKITQSGDVAIEIGDLIVGGVYQLIYSTTANSSAGGWVMMGATAAPSGPTYQAFTANGTWTKPTGCKKIIIGACGGGGGGGGINGTVNTGRGSGGGGGGAYGWTASLDVTGVTSFAVTIGAGGAAGVGAGNVAGGTGGTTSCTVNGTSYQWNGGSGAPSPNSSPGSSLTRGGFGGFAVAGVNTGGNHGGFGGAWWDTAAGSGNAQGGCGGSTPWGTGGMGGSVVVASADTAISGPIGYGAGGQGRGMINATATVNGGAGTGGIMFIYEYY